MNLKPYLPRTLQKKRFLALLFIAALLAAGTFSGCASKTKDKTKTKETESQEDTDDLTSKETPTEISAIEKEEEEKKQEAEARAMIEQMVKEMEMSYSELENAGHVTDYSVTEDGPKEEKE